MKEPTLVLQKKIDPFTSSADHYHLYMKTIPTDSGEFPDITFRFSYRFYKKRHEELESLKSGDIINFKVVILVISSLLIFWNL